ncbi:2Fe-2S iron-sulfur cluster binding domain-containing protein [Puniceibacterium sp. IMCC21224]|uniref:2Fe-2S iron-sulfur cluster-binding protein n=1 Tax=Puniceibacterium sp. IMCC21224 TaxID=1618204 RepID=UPI00064D8890|nr:2Fe-2S iron-sulfur cluster binding domain-containing protein [Puniceibacterium sp. IMCC21224]KMK65019.1 2-polyprenylphenol hydroxylase-like oxidoreductase [Puniceibacterium sp. IMCC21224]
MARITNDRDGESFDCNPDDTILRAALRAGQGMPYSCNVGSCGNCRFELIEGEVVHLRDDAPAWSERDLKRNRWLGCQARPVGDCRVKFRVDPVAVPPAPPIRREAELLETRKITRDITEFTFAIQGSDDFRPGQYALLSAPGIDGGRAYSMANLPGEGVWRFMIKRVPGGGATGYLFDSATPGERISIDGPYGTAWLRQGEERDILLMAGGSGLSPMVSIARGARAAGMLDNRKLEFFYGCRATPDLFEPDNVLTPELAKHVHFTAALSEPGEGWTGQTGFLHDVVKATTGERLAQMDIFFAGPPAMAQAIQLMAHEAGVPQSQLFFDEFY